MALGGEDRLTACCDTNEGTANLFADEFKCACYTDYQGVLSEVQSDSVVISVVNRFAAGIAIDALRSGRHVLAEKPLGRNYNEAKEILRVFDEVREAQRNIPVLKTGFNHRFHPAIRKAKELADTGAIGRLLNIRAAYGHGGRPGMEKEWRASKDLCGGGELLDQGVHIIDLVRWFGGEIRELTGNIETKFWNMEVEDNAYVIAKTETGVTASFHVSWTNWKNIFSFELFGTDGYLTVTGLGGSYGKEGLEYGVRNTAGGPPKIGVFEFSGEDTSWTEEWAEFKSAVTERRKPLGNGYDGMKANEVIEAIYRSSAEGKMVRL